MKSVLNVSHFLLTRDSSNKLDIFWINIELEAIDCHSSISSVIKIFCRNLKIRWKKKYFYII